MNSFIFLCVVTLFATLSFGGDAANTAGVGKSADWSYNSDATGPENWGKITPDYEVCQSGKTQSPVNISSSGAKSTCGSPVVRFYNSSLKFKEAENNFKVDCGNDKSSPCGEVWYDQNTYYMLQIHAHSPSEYTLNGVSYPLELHFVHQSEDEKYAVVGVFFKFGEENAQIAEFLQAPSKKTVSIDLSELYHQHSMACTLKGSLTTPPCTEGVQWIVSWGVLEISPPQMDAFRALTGNVKTNRPIQPMNGRDVKCYH